MTPGFYLDLDERTYHAHEGSLSYSGAKVLASAPPAVFDHQRRHPVYKDAFDFGSVVHSLVLGKGGDGIYVAPFENWKSGAAQEERRLARESGLSPVLIPDWLKACDMAEEVARHREAADLLAGGEAEVSMFCRDDRTGVLRRGRVDYLRAELIVDFKTTARSASAAAFVKDAANFGYYQQDPWYLDLAWDLGANTTNFHFVVQETDAPYLVAVHTLDDAARQAGREANNRALEIYRDCTQSGIWPGHLPDEGPLSLPTWALKTKEYT